MKLACVRLTALIASFVFGIAAAENSVKALTGGTLIDGYGGPPLRNSVIILEGSKIKAIGQVGTLALPSDAEVISTEGMTVLPGLWDMHVHVMLLGHADYDHWDATYLKDSERVIMPAAAKQLLMAGITSARDLGGPLEASINTRDAIKAGRLAGPTLYVSGPFLQHRPYPNTEAFRWGIDGEKDARAKVRTLARAGVDVIKVVDQDQMTDAEFLALVDEAHKARKPVVAHAHRPEEILRGVAAGVDCFEHTGLAAAPGYPEDVVRALRSRTSQMSLGPLFWTPTVSGLLFYENVRNNPESLDDPSWQEGVPAPIVADIKQSLAHFDRLPYYQLNPLRRPTLVRKMRELQESGVTMLAGTDSGIPGRFHSQSLWQELDAWVNHYGIDPMVALRAATYWPAVAMKAEARTGTITEGKDADIIAVRGDVLTHINLLSDVDVVIRHGVRHK
jgi:imidazolonepropionase-like amidohydrolase